MVNKSINHTYIRINGKSRINLDGVINVREFEDSFVILETTERPIHIEGKELRLESLSREGGEIEISGKIEGVYYASENKIKKRFRELFG